MNAAAQERPVLRYVVLAGFLAAVAVAAVVGAVGVQGTTDTYRQLEQPAWAPPSWLFGPVWTVLYAMIAVSGWLVWRQVGWSRELVPYGVQLVLNALWTPLFFGSGLRGLALVDIVLLWLGIAWTVWVFRKVRPVAAALLLPYWAWVSFATALNASIWYLNR
ncbi:TspO/MBR family protein [Kribbella sp. CA-293567]|uniref:TspO/MBR family protein n=1 Tax=Kribbella sp. CA-293567 TaxID=3002436 RepID=UPI0022DD6EED|nr:TspO/MBR family protein [Kribbella sp. CA-293567]WBQ08227.1 tryptophan-rich sensory protein [Kribbella sp. CA-293567]